MPDAKTFHVDLSLGSANIMKMFKTNQKHCHFSSSKPSTFASNHEEVCARYDDHAQSAGVGNISSCLTPIGCVYKFYTTNFYYLLYWFSALSKFSHPFVTRIISMCVPYGHMTHIGPPILFGLDRVHPCLLWLNFMLGLQNQFSL